MTSESADPSIAAYSDGSTASDRSRLTCGKPRISPLWTHSQRPRRNGWPLVCWTAVPVEARMWARSQLPGRASRWARLSAPAEQRRRLGDPT
jgi:hypothetical protein